MAFTCSGVFLFLFRISSVPFRRFCGLHPRAQSRGLDADNASRTRSSFAYRVEIVSRARCPIYPGNSLAGGEESNKHANSI